MSLKLPGDDDDVSWPIEDTRAVRRCPDEPGIPGLKRQETTTTTRAVLLLSQ